MRHTHLRPHICVALGMEVVGWLFWFVLVGCLLSCFCFWVVGCFVYLGFIFGWLCVLWFCVDCFGLYVCCWSIHFQVSLLGILVS